MKIRLQISLLSFVVPFLWANTALAQASLNFNGGYLSRGTVISAATTNFTIETWVKWNGSGGNQAIIYNGSTAGSGYGLYLLTGGKITGLMGGVAFVESGVSLTANEWTHLALVRNSTTLTLYKNGTSIATSTAAPNGLNNPSIQNENFTIGANNGGNEVFKGDIDEVRFWTTERSQSQIQSNMNATFSVQANLVAYYTFNNGTPNANNAGITVIPDVSGNNNTLTLNNFTLTGTVSNFVQNFVEIYYVNAAATGDGRGHSWANAAPQLADVLKWARLQNNYTTANPLKIYVAKGTYKPMYNAADGQFTTDGGRDNAFVMVSNVQIYGGFDPANGINTLTDSRLLPSPSGGNGGGSVLSGDLDNNGTRNDNDTYHVVVSSGEVGTASLDGFTVTGAYNGGNASIITVNGRPIYRNCGGAMHNNTSSPTLINCSFIANTGYNGAGMYNNTSSPTLTDCNFTANAAGNGGGMYNNFSSPSITKCKFTTNTATYEGGGMFNYSSSSPTIGNCIFSGNTAIYGGGLYNYSPSSTPKLVATTIANNGSRGLYSVSGTSVLYNSIVWDVVTGNYAATFSLVKGANPMGTGNINATSLAATDIFTDYEGGDYTLKSYSPAINKGNNQLYWDVVNGGIVPLPPLGEARWRLDLAGNPRVYKYATSGIIDIGAYEYQSTDIAPDANNILYVNTAVSGGLSNGSNWANAITELADALKWARQKNNFTSDNPLKIYVAKGAYKPMYNAGDGSFTTNGNRYNAFVMVNNVQLYGGFDPANNIDDLTDTRIFGSGGSILSGDIGTVGIKTDNTYHVVISSGAVGTARLDGFTISGGYNTAASINDEMFINGGEIYQYYGGGMYNCASSSPAIANCSFTANTSYYGGGMYNQSSSPTLTNCSFTENTALNGGAIYNHYYHGAITNTTIAKNGNNGFYNDYSTTILQNTIVWDMVIGNYTAKNSLIKGKTDVTNGNVNAGSLSETNVFANYAGGDYTLKNGSPAIAKGDNTLFTGVNANTKDLSGNVRVYNYATGGTIDMGAYEYQGLSSPTISGFANVTKTYGNAAFALTVPTSNSNNAFTYTGNNTSVCTISGSTVTIVGVGTATITATQQSNANYDVGTKTLTLTVDKASQTISFATLDPKTTTSADFALTATASSGLAVSYTSSNTAVAEVYQDGGVWKVKIKGEGSTDITASQSGDGSYAAAAAVVQQLIVVGVPLPVTLMSYTAKAEGNYAKLEWKTSAETNNKGFEIYRSGDDKQRVKIGDVHAVHNSQPTIYNFTDKQSLNGNNYYRLVQIDKDGKPTELGERVLSFSLSVTGVNIYPNPVLNSVNITFGVNQFRKLELIDMNGEIIATRSILPKEQQHTFETSKFPSGVYIVRLIGENKVAYEKMIKK